MSDPIDTFKQEAQEHLAALESALLELEENPSDEAGIAAAFRSMHTIKGGAGMVGFDFLSGFTHHLETLFDKVRNGDLHLSSDLCHLLLQVCDQIRELLNHPEPDQESKDYSNDLILLITGFLPDRNSPLNQALANQASADESSKAECSASSEDAFEAANQDFSEAHLSDAQCSKVFNVLVSMQPHSLSFQEGFDVLPVVREFNELAEADSFSCVSEYAFVDGDFDPHINYGTFSVSFAYRCLDEAQARQAIDDVFIFVQDDWQIDIKLSSLTTSVDEQSQSSFLEKAPSPKELHQTELHTIESQPEKDQQVKAKLQDAGSSQTCTARKSEPLKAPKSNQAQGKKEQGKKEQEDAFIRVPQQKLDALMDQVGELVIMQAGLDEHALKSDNTTLQNMSEELHRLTNNLRDIAFDIRMLPIGSAFSRFKRLVRDTAKDLSKQVRLETKGAETELDKVVLNKLIDPLIHILRNSLDHGIESGEQRLSLNKTEQGLIKLSAWHEQGQIIIEVADDGAGLDQAVILEKAIEKGLLTQASANDLSENEIYQLIFEPGFSTAKTVTDVSGRGVGMDVVRSSIAALQGKINIQSQRGEGTTITIQLPMTLSIIDGLMVSVASEKFIIPLSEVQECVEQHHADEDDGVICHREKLIPKLSLRKSFSLPGTAPAIEQVVIVNTDDGLIGVTVDEVDGNHQTVIRNIGRLYQDTPGVMGATILGNGGIAMILELSALMRETQ